MQRFDRDSEVYKMIQENKESRTAPRQSNTFRMLQEVLEADEKGEGGPPPHTHTRMHTHKIGRASCRERVSSPV